MSEPIAEVRVALGAQFDNARTARLLLERAVLRQGARLHERQGLGELTNDDLVRIVEDDIPEPSEITLRAEE